MNDPQKTTNELKALVTVFEDTETAAQAIVALIENGFEQKQVEYVSHDVTAEAPELTTPKIHETTTSALVDAAIKWGTVGAGVSALAAIATPFPGLALGMIVTGGLTGAIVGGMAGVEHAVEDDSVDLPTVEEYKAIVENGKKLVVVLGTHADAMKAENVIEDLPFIHSHTHVVHGHEFHEHPARK